MLSQGCSSCRGACVKRLIERRLAQPPPQRASALLSKSHRDADKRVEILCGFGDSEVAPTVQLDILSQRVGKSCVEGNDQVSLSQLAEEFHVALKVADDVVGEGDRVDEIWAISPVFSQQ